MADQTNPAPAAPEQPQEPAAAAPEVEPLGDGGKAALAAERKARRDADAQLKALQAKLQEFEDRDKSELEKLQARLAAAEKQATEATLKALRADVAQAKGVPAGLLSGSTEEELNASADALLAFRGETAKVPAAPSAAGQGNVGKPVSTGVQQLTRGELDGMTPEQITQAKAEGRLNALLGIK